MEGMHFLPVLFGEPEEEAIILFVGVLMSL